MPIQFTNPDTAQYYETDFENDPIIMVNCPCNGGMGYRGPLSGIPPGAAAELVATKSNLVKPRVVKKKPAEE